MVWHYLFNGVVYITPAVAFHPTESAFYPIFFITEGTVEAGGGKFCWGEILMGPVIGIRAYTGGYRYKARG
jgi:hypothetical protein